MNVHAAKHITHKHVAHATGTKGSSASKDSSAATSGSSGSGPVAVVQFSDAAVQAANAAAAVQPASK